MRCNKAKRRAFTLTEMLVVVTILMLFALMGGFLYNNSLKLYRENVGLMQVFQENKRISQQMRDYFAGVLPVPTEWVSPRLYSFEGVSNATEYVTDGTPRASDIDYGYLNPSRWDAKYNHPTKGEIRGKTKWYARHDYLDEFFSGPTHGYGNAGTPKSKNVGEFISFLGNHNLPGFFGQTPDTAGDFEAWLFKHHNDAGSWGWPRPDYRLDAHADPNVHADGEGKDLSCWFYTENPNFEAPFTLGLDNPNILLVSLKFSRWLQDGREHTRLSFLKHHIVGMDFKTKESIREDLTFADMLRQFKIEPMELKNGKLEVNLNDVSQTGPGDSWAPRAFDIHYTLRNTVSLQEFRFGLRLYCRANPNPAY